MVTGTKESLLELNKQLESVYPTKASIIGAGSTKGMNALHRRLMPVRDRDIVSARPSTR